MELFPLKSRLIKPKSDLFEEVENAWKKARKIPQNGDILVVASKVVSVCENRIVSATSTLIEAKIAKEEADIWLGGKPYPFSIKNGILIPRSGVDASNSPQKTLILWPKNPWKSARDLREKIVKKYGLKRFGVVISDSTCRPMRWGVSGIALAWSGFKGVEDARGMKDLYGKKLKVTRKNIGDALASMSGILMGEGNEKTPFVLIRDAKVKFTKVSKKPKQIQPNEDLFSPIYKDDFRKLKI